MKKKPAPEELVQTTVAPAGRAGLQARHPTPPRAIYHNAATARSFPPRAKEADLPRPLPFTRSRSSRMRQI